MKVTVVPHLPPPLARKETLSDHWSTWDRCPTAPWAEWEQHPLPGLLVTSTGILLLMLGPDSYAASTSRRAQGHVKTWGRGLSPFRGGTVKSRNSQRKPTICQSFCVPGTPFSLSVSCSCCKKKKSQCLLCHRSEVQNLILWTEFKVPNRAEPLPETLRKNPFIFSLWWPVTILGM
jgi:hypothetical protein